jgi:DNA-binding FadR family transcriptional regulator
MWKGKSMRHQFTSEERARGARKTNQNKEHQSAAYRALEEKDPVLARKILQRYYTHVGWGGRKRDE